MNYTDRINPTNKGLTTYLDELISMNYQIPTFQRDVVWEKDNVKKLWDSIYKFYPLGSILIWKTGLKLSNHRKIGGHKICDENFNRTEYQYILDGQQRTTSLLTSLYGGSIEGKPDFDPTIYVDITIPIEEEIDGDSYKKRFLFWDEIYDANGTLKQNIGKNKKFQEGLIIKLLDINKNYQLIFNKIFQHQDVKNNIEHNYIKELGKLQGVLNNYRLSFIEIKGIQVDEVCQIFERINQAGKPLSIFDIVVAKTYRPPLINSKDTGFYLRDLIGDFRNKNNSEFLNISDMDYLQILAIIINQYLSEHGVRNITDKYLNEIKSTHIEEIWEDAKTAILKTFDFFENHLHIKVPSLVPFRYFYFTITSYFYKNLLPDYSFLKKYFWFYSFHNDELLSNTTHLFQHLDLMNKEKSKELYNFPRFLIDKQKLRSATYSSRGRISRAILSLYANSRPKDWQYCDREVLCNNLFFTSDKPNLHHIFPTNSEYVLINKHNNKINSDSLMNIAYLTQITNQNITNKNPLDYLKIYDNEEFKKIMPNHMLPSILMDWAREDLLPDNALDLFVEERVEKILSNIKDRLAGVHYEEIDTMETGGALV